MASVEDANVTDPEYIRLYGLISVLRSLYFENVHFYEIIVIWTKYFRSV